MNLKELSKIVDLCRKKGVETIEFTMDGQPMKLTMGQPPPKRAYVRKESSIKPSTADDYEKLLNWSVTS